MIRINSVNDPIPNEVHPHLSEIQNVSKITSIAETSHVMLLWLHANDAPILPHQYLFFPVRLLLLLLLSTFRISRSR